MTVASVFSISAQLLAPERQWQGWLYPLDGYAYGGDAAMESLPPRMVDGTAMVDAFIATDGDSPIQLLESMGVKVNCIFDGFVTAQVPADRLDLVASLPGVTDVEVSPRLALCTDTTMSVTHVNEVMNGPDYGLPQAYDGTGVIVGVIDVGFDFQHMAFRSGSDPSRSRIVRVYDTQSSNGHPAYCDKSGYLPGSVFMGDEIYSLTTDAPSSTHGTHTASIAAGTHVNGYGGMAPGADIVLCAVSMLDGSMSAVEVANCVRYIDAYADSVGKPCVISVSVSTPHGQHDGQDYLSLAIKQTMGPGRIFVISSGNTAGSNCYAHGKASPSKPLNLMLAYENSLGGDSTYYYGAMSADVWMRGKNVNYYYKIQVLDRKTSNIVWETPQMSGANFVYASELQGYYDAYNVADTLAFIKLVPSYVSYGRKYRVNVTVRNLVSHVYSTVGGVKQSRYALGLSIYPRQNTTCEIDAWTGNSSSGYSFFPKPIKGADGVIRYPYFAAASDSCCIGTFAVGDSTLSAGAYAARNTYYSLSLDEMVVDNTVTLGQIAPFSSFQIAGAGPTGKALPDICAPGTNVVAAGSRYSYFAHGGKTTVMNVNGNYWGVMSGTSMAAPTVAGIIALWLQANPQLSVADVREIFANTAQHDMFTSQPQFGPNGKIDALAGMDYVLDHTAPMLGDVNGSGNIDILDAVAFINYLLNGQTAGFHLRAADLNHDGVIDISDLTALINILLGV